MTTRYIGFGSALLVALCLYVPAPSVQAASADLTFSVSNVTIVPKPPTCDARATKKRILSGDATTIVWKSKGAAYMTGLTNEEKTWPRHGRQRVAIGFPGMHEFPLTFVSKDGWVSTCMVRVFVKSRPDAS